MGAILPLSEETVGGLSLPPTVTLTVKAATMGEVKLIVHECFTGSQNPEDVFTVVFLSNAATLTEASSHMRYSIRPSNIQRIIDLTIVLGATIGVIYLVANDITGVGVVDAAAIVPLLPIIVDNAGKVFS